MELPQRPLAVLQQCSQKYCTVTGYQSCIALQVAQLHVHVTLRSPKDPSWPGPCYGAVPPKPYTPQALEDMLTRLRPAIH